MEGGLKERGLVKEGGLFTKPGDKERNDSFLFLLRHILQILHTLGGGLNRGATVIQVYKF